jgi:hypothetical protein
VLEEATDEVDGAVGKEEAGWIELVKAANQDEVVDAASGTVVMRDPHGVVAVIACGARLFTMDSVVLGLASSGCGCCAGHGARFLDRILHSRMSLDSTLLA